LERFRRQILAFFVKNFDLEALPSPLRELAQDSICIPCYRKQMTKLQLARSIISERQSAEIARLNQEIAATFLNVSQPLISCAKADSQFNDHIADISDDGRPLLTSPEWRKKLLQWLRNRCTQTPWRTVCELKEQIVLVLEAENLIPPSRS
jgi:hypothetical protein